MKDITAYETDDEIGFYIKPVESLYVDLKKTEFSKNLLSEIRDFRRCSWSPKYSLSEIDDKLTKVDKGRYVFHVKIYGITGVLPNISIDSIEAGHPNFCNYRSKFTYWFKTMRYIVNHYIDNGDQLESILSQMNARLKAFLLKANNKAYYKAFSEVARHTKQLELKCIIRKAESQAEKDFETRMAFEVKRIEDRSFDTSTYKDNVNKLYRQLINNYDQINNQYKTTSDTFDAIKYSGAERHKTFDRLGVISKTLIDYVYDNIEKVKMDESTILDLSNQESSIYDTHITKLLSNESMRRLRLNKNQQKIKQKSKGGKTPVRLKKEKSFRWNGKQTHKQNQLNYLYTELEKEELLDCGLVDFKKIFNGDLKYEAIHWKGGTNQLLFLRRYLVDEMKLVKDEDSRWNQILSIFVLDKKPSKNSIKSTYSKLPVGISKLKISFFDDLFKDSRFDK